MSDDLPLPPGYAVWAVQLRYHLRRLLRNPRALSTGVLLPVLLLVLADEGRGHLEPARLAGLAVLGASMTAWTTHGIGLVAAREAGELRRFRAMPIPRWSFLAARVCASVLVAAVAGLATIMVGALCYGTRVDVASVLVAPAVLVLGAGAWAGAATAVTRLITGVDTAWPVLGLSYLPVVITSGALGSTQQQPAWLHSAAALLPARPMVDALGAALGPGPVATRDVVTLLVWAVAGLVAAALVFRWDPTRR